MQEGARDNARVNKGQRYSDLLKPKRDKESLLVDMAPGFLHTFSAALIHTSHGFGLIIAMQTGLVLAALMLVSFSALGALPPQSAEALKKNSALIVVGKVQAVYTSEQKTDRGFVNRLYVFEVVVNSVEKGEGLKEGKVIYTKAWTPASRPLGWAGPQGQNRIPKEGETGKLYLTQGEDGSLSLVTPNGWEGK